ncbi:MAG TPA: hypothetical protein VGD10_01660 [Allosphingosinicella sp.]|uniref:hypothetical protein n=1 Tax=Allosphingosinicella sp. TaxID=2823234 RepID=UPI002EDA88EC
MSDLKSLVEAELSLRVDLRVSAMAAAIAAQYGSAARAVLFYGSCLRTSDLDGQMLDFYLIVSDYRAAYGKRWLAAANRLIPPNVFPLQYQGLAGKYAVLSEDDFRRECSARAKTVSVWARFAQPSRLVWSADEEAKSQAVESIALAAPTLLAFTLPMLREGEEADALAIWRRGFALTYDCELRAERKERPGSIVDADPQRYQAFAEAALPGIRPFSSTAARQIWESFRKRGKRASVLRLAKASATFAGGIDYLAWKINRHAGTDIKIAPWQRRWPLLGAVTLLPRLLKRGAIR